MPSPYVEPGNRSARPGIRHRAHSNGPDRKDRDPNTLSTRPLPARLASEDGSTRLIEETEDEAFFSGEDNGVLTHPEDNDDDDDEEEEEEEEDDLSQDGMEAATPALRRSNDLPRRSRTYNGGARKLAPEEEEWALKDERKRRKGGVFGRLVRLGRGKKGNDHNDTGDGEAYDAQAILGRSRSAVTELRSRPNTVQRPRKDSEARSISRGSYGRRAAAASLASRTAVGVAYKSYGKRDSSSRGGSTQTGDETGSSETGTPRRPLLQAVASEDESQDKVEGISDVPPRMGTPVALKEAENARSPKFLEPYMLDMDTAIVRTKSRAESVQPNVLEVDTIAPSSPLIPVFGPLSHQDAIVPSARLSMQSARDQEIDDEPAYDRSRKLNTSSNIDLQGAVGGALGRLAAIIEFDVLKESKDGYPRSKDEDQAETESPVVNKDLPASGDPTELVGTPKKLKKKSKRSKNASDDTANGALVGARASSTLLAVETDVEKVKSPAMNGSSEPPYTKGVSPTKIRRNGSISRLDDAELEADGKKKKKSKVAAPAVPGVGIGGLASVAIGDRSDDDHPIKKKSKSKKYRSEVDGGAVIYSNVPASGTVLAEEELTVKRKKSKRNKELAAAAVVAVPAAFIHRDIAPEYVEAEDYDGSDIGTPTPVETYPNEKADYVSLDMVAAAPLVVEDIERKKSKRSKGSRPVEKMPILDEDELPRTSGRKGFLLTPSIAPSVADPLDSGRRSIRSVGQGGGDWLSKSLSAQQTHYFLREMAQRELGWELDRAWLLTSFEKPTKDRCRTRQRQLADLEHESRINDFDDSSDEDLFDNSDEEDEEAVFCRSPNSVAQSVPDLPLLGFLFKNAFCTFPLFVAPEDKLSSYGSSPPDKATIARSYFFAGILPLLRNIQSKSLSAPVDRHGEGDGTPFSAQSTTGAIRGILLKWASKYVTAVLRVGYGDPYFGEDDALDKDSWPWPAPNLLPPEAFFAYRKPLDRIKYGGYEIDVVGIRQTVPAKRDYIIRVRRPNRLDEYVVRNDADFQEYQRSLSRDLNSFAFVKKLPKTRGMPDEDSEDGAESPIGSTDFNVAGIGSGLQTYKENSGRGSTNSLRRRGTGREPRTLGDSKWDRRRRYSSAKKDGRPALGRRAIPEEVDDVFDEELVGRRQTVSHRYRRDLVDQEEGDEFSDDTAQPRNGRRPRGTPISDEETEVSRGTPRANKTKKSLLPFPLSSLGKNRNSSIRRKDTLDSRRRGISHGLPGANDSRNSVSFRDGVDTRYDSSPRRTAPSPMDFEGRRNKLREWLRDTLSVREAGHAVETQNFLSIGSFPDRALRRPDLMDMYERKRQDKHRRHEHEMDASKAGDNVSDLRSVRDQLWSDCVEGDGFLKMYDTLRDTPDYARLPLKYQKMVSWGNLQMARFLYGTFVAGDESLVNLARLQDVFESIPWKKLAFAMKSPVSQMVRSWQDHLLRKGFLQGLLHVMLEDEPQTIDEDLAVLRRSIGSDVMFRKVRMFVESPDDLKRLIRQHAERAEIPLVAAIARGSEQPKLNKAEVQRVMDATQAYQDFIKTQPSVIKKNEHKEPGYLLITDLQRTLRLLSLQRDGAQVRGMLQDPAIGDALGAIFEPLLEELGRMHRVKGISNSLMALQSFLARLIEHLLSLRARVQDPARSINSIAKMLDNAAPSWYTFLYKLADVSPTVFSFFAWFRHLSMTVGAGTDDLAAIWTNPPSAPVEEGVQEDGSYIAPAPRAVLDAATMRDINGLAEYGRRKRNRQMEIACRWAAGETDSHHPIQVPGDGTGKIRTDPYLPKEARPVRRAPGLDRFRKTFREAVSIALAR